MVGGGFGVVENLVHFPSGIPLNRLTIEDSHAALTSVHAFNCYK
jgi:hypothetical protein